MNAKRLGDLAERVQFRVCPLVLDFTDKTLVLVLVRRKGVLRKTLGHVQPADVLCQCDPNFRPLPHPAGWTTMAPCLTIALKLWSGHARFRRDSLGHRQSRGGQPSRRGRRHDLSVSHHRAGGWLRSAFRASVRAPGACRVSGTDASGAFVFLNGPDSCRLCFAYSDLGPRAVDFDA